MYRRSMTVVRSQYCGIFSHRYVTTWTPLTPVPLKVSQGSSLRLEIKECFKDVNILVETKWEDFVSIASNQENMPHAEVLSNEQGVSLSLSKDIKNSADILTLHILIPEHFDLSIKGPKMRLKLQNKLLGNLLIVIPDGEVTIDKVKGPELGIYVGEANLRVNKVLEGNVSIDCHSMSGKMVNGESISIAAKDSVNIEAMYGSQTLIKAENNVDVGLFRGKLQCELNGNANIRGIDGSVAVQSHSGDISLHINSLLKVVENHPSNSVFAENGNISCLFDPEVKLNVFCEASKEKSPSLEICSDAFIPEQLNPHSALGYFSGFSQATKRPVFQGGRGGGVGKIDLKGAERQSFYRGGSATGSGDNESSRQELPQTLSSMSSTADKDLSSDYERSTLLVVAPHGKVLLKTISWIEMIKLKHGLP